jgi:hypothetical protein
VRPAPSSEPQARAATAESSNLAEVRYANWPIPASEVLQFDAQIDCKRQGARSTEIAAPFPSGTMQFVNVRWVRNEGEFISWR